MIEILQKVGLIEKEAKVYLATLKLGSAPAAKVAQAAELNRPNAYVLLEKLQSLGLVSVFEKGKIQFFSAADPDQLFRLVEQERQSIEATTAELGAKLPELKAFYGQTARPRVLLYDSDDAAEAHFYSRLNVGDTVYAFTDFDLLEQTGQEKAEPELRKTKGIKTHVIYTRNDGPISGATDSGEMRVAKFVPRHEFPFNSVMSTAPQAGLIFLRDAITNTMVIIENASLAASLKAVFDLVWQKIE